MGKLVREHDQPNHALAVQVDVGKARVGVLAEAVVQMSPSNRATRSTRKGAPKVRCTSAVVHMPTGRFSKRACVSTCSLRTSLPLASKSRL